MNAVFSRHDAGGGGFVATDALKPLLADLGIDVTQDAVVRQIKSAVDSDNMGIILWDSFFNAIVPFLRACSHDMSNRVACRIACCCSHAVVSFAVAAVLCSHSTTRCCSDASWSVLS